MKKIIPYCLILVFLLTLVGVVLFSPAGEMRAQEINQYGEVIYSAPGVAATPEEARELEIQAGRPPTAPVSSGNALYDSLSDCPPVDGCIAKIIYFLFYAIPSFLLGVAAHFFDVIIRLTIQSDLYTKATFIGNAWSVVRDFSNIFFILILLYVAIRTILGLGGHEVKKTIAQVIIMALLINFSMFFTKVVIDSSNILALVFYDKINTTIVKDGKTIEPNYIPSLAGGGDKDIAGKMMAYFDPTKILSKEFFDKFRKKTYTFSTKSALVSAGGGALVGSWIPVLGTGVGAVVGVVGYTLSGFSNSIPLSISSGFIIVAGAIIIFATYAFFIAGLAFLSRMIELWILIIFSPFAFMSFALPKLAGMDYIGWEAWTKRLIRLAFMAPIFMFFMFLIFMIIQSNIFTSLVARSDADQGWMETIIFMVIPAMIIIILLLKATKYAKEASGQLGAAVMGMAKVAGGLALGGGIGLAAAGMQGTLGHLGKKVFESKGLTDAEAKGSRLARGLRTIAGGNDGKGGLAGSSFDLRKGVAGGALGVMSKATGLDFGQQSKFLMKESGGYMADLQRRDAKRKERAEGLKIKEGEDEKQHLNEMKENHQTLSLANEGAIHKKDRDITSAKEKVMYLKDVAESHLNKEKDTEGNYKDPEYVKKLEAYSKAANEVKKLKDERRQIKNARAIDQAAAKLAVEAAEKVVNDAKKALEADPSDINKEKVAEYSHKLDIKRAELASAKTGGYSQNDYEDKLIPEAEHEVKHVSDKRMRSFANSLTADTLGNNLQFWNRSARKKSAHEIRMGVKPEKHSEKGGGGGAGNLLGHAAVEWAGQALSGHGHKEEGGDKPPASPSH